MPFLGVVACYGSDALYHETLHFYNCYSRLSDEAKRAKANTLILGGVLKGALENGCIADKIGGVLANCDRQKAKAIIFAVLLHGDTATAHERVFNKNRIEEGKLNLAGMAFVTVRDWKRQDWFDQVYEINLQENELNELPGAFFRMFPALKKINVSNNPITYLDTTSMPYGFGVIAKNTQLQTISGTNLATQQLTFNIYNTPLARDVAALKGLRAACTVYSKNLLSKFIEGCFGKDPDEQLDTSSAINT